MGKKFKELMCLVDEVQHIKEKISFMGEVMAALALREDTGGLSDAALCGLYHVNNDIENQCEAVSEALIHDFHVIAKTDKEAHLDNFCSTVENAANAKISQA